MKCSPGLTLFLAAFIVLGLLFGLQQMLQPKIDDQAAAPTQQWKRNLSPSFDHPPINNQANTP